jgi:zinc transport system ATP-binding protein
MTVPVAGRVTRAPGLRVGYVPQRLHLDPSLPLTVARFLGSASVGPVADPGAAGAGRRAGGGGAADGAAVGRAVPAGAAGARAGCRSRSFWRWTSRRRGWTSRASQPSTADRGCAQRELGCAVLMVSHDLHVVMSASDRVICLNGHVCCQGTPERGFGGAGIPRAVRDWGRAGRWRCTGTSMTITTIPTTIMTTAR